MKFRFEFSKDIQKTFKENYQPMAKAATAAMNDAAELAKKRGRQSIAAAGFGIRWQNTLRSNVYPTNRDSAGAAAFIFHKIPYSNIWETGGIVVGRPYMWIPLPETLRRFKGYNGGRITVKAFIRQGRRLWKAKTRPGQTPLLLGEVVDSTATIFGKRNSRRKRVPLFYGIELQNLRRKFRIREACAYAAAQLPALYFKNFRDEV